MAGEEGGTGVSGADGDEPDVSHCLGKFKSLCTPLSSSLD